MSNAVIRALVTTAKKTPAKVEMLSVASLPKECTVKRSPGKCDVKVKGRDRSNYT